MTVEFLMYEPMLKKCCQGIHHMDEWISVGFLTRHEVAGRETEKKEKDGILL